MKILCVVISFCLLNISAFSDEVVATKSKKQKVFTPKLESQNNTERYENISLLQKVLYFVEQNYVEEVKSKDLIYGAIKGMIDTLDPHSGFLPPEIFKEMKADTSGKFGGIGIEIGLKHSILTVITPIEDTPAFKAGIKSGDRILKINGDSTKGFNLVEAVSKMRGKKGTDVLVTIWRDGFEKPQDIKITRAEIKIQSAKSEVLEPGFLFVRLTTFNERSSEDLRKSIESYEKKHGTLKGLVLDLRNNPGGLLDQAIDVTSLFIDEGLVVSTMGRNNTQKDSRFAKKGMARKDFPLAILVNGASASASEIVAGALQDHKRALVLGQPTFGKGSVQTVIELQPEVGLKLTIARYYTPSGRSIQLKGIEPDVLLDDLDPKIIAEATKKGTTGMLREKDLKHYLSHDSDEEKEFAPEEYMISSQVSEKQEDKKIVENKSKENENKPYVAKEDYQVRQALNYIKSYQLFEKAKANLPTSLLPRPVIESSHINSSATN